MVICCLRIAIIAIIKNKLIFIPVTIPFITAGLCLGHLFFLPWFDRALYDEYHLWPYFTFLFSIVVTASTISIIKLGNGKYIFEHFVYLFVASILFLTSGILFVLPTKRKFHFLLTHSLKMSIMHKKIYQCVSHINRYTQTQMCERVKWKEL